MARWRAPARHDAAIDAACPRCASALIHLRRFGRGPILTDLYERCHTIGELSIGELLCGKRTFGIGTFTEQPYLVPAVSVPTGQPCGFSTMPVILPRATARSAIADHAAFAGDPLGSATYAFIAYSVNR